ncbi:response regulator transcription factor [Enterobacter ludwigii]|uniref:response regulator n=1 Tax=unclassified Enterobacter TaxID=2608935 RepID=UPI001ABDDBDA|nr:response regulator transcription factor [Enterobacter ludwigii]UOY72377.1 response regulator transcription factor [Enterobacter ludwigii]
MRILLVEDDAMIGEIVAESLREASFAVDWVKNGNDALSTFVTQHYDLVLLDLGLPGKDGFSVMAGMRKHSATVSVLIITARDALEDRLRGLNGGADDYIIKPFDLSELVARIHAVLRRNGGSGSPVLTNGELMLDPDSHEVQVTTSGLSFLLSNREFAVLEALLIRPGGILSRSDLEDRIYGWGEEVESNAIEFLIHSLRKKIGRDAIRNVRGVGWLVPKSK